MLQPGFSKSSQHLPLLGRRPSITRIQPEVLNSWKQISAFVGRGVRTVQRWERSSGMPVHRIGHGNRAPVYVLVNELNYWLANSESTDIDVSYDKNHNRESPLAHTNWRRKSQVWPTQ